MILTVSLSAMVSGCGGKKQSPPTSGAGPAAPPATSTPPRPTTRPTASRRGTLYERLGGEAAVRAVVDDFVSRAAADPAVNFRREGHATTWQPTPENLDRLKQRLVEFVATTAGGPMQYRGNDMVTAHRGMAITNAEFNALAGHLRAALEANNVPRREREELLTAVASMRGAIVESADAPAPDTSTPPDTTAAEPQPPADAATDAKPVDAPAEGAPPEQSNPADAPAPPEAAPKESEEPKEPADADAPKPDGDAPEPAAADPQR